MQRFRKEGDGGGAIQRSGTPADFRKFWVFGVILGGLKDALWYFSRVFLMVFSGFGGFVGGDFWAFLIGFWIFFQAPKEQILRGVFGFFSI